MSHLCAVLHLNHTFAEIDAGATWRIQTRLVLRFHPSFGQSYCFCRRINTWPFSLISKAIVLNSSESAVIFFLRVALKSFYYYSELDILLAFAAKLVMYVAETWKSAKDLFFQSNLFRKYFDYAHSDRGQQRWQNQSDRVNQRAGIVFNACLWFSPVPFVFICHTLQYCRWR